MPSSFLLFSCPSSEAYIWNEWTLWWIAGSWVVQLVMDGWMVEVYVTFTFIWCTRNGSVVTVSEFSRGPRFLSYNQNPTIPNFIKVKNPNVCHIYLICNHFLWVFTVYFGQNNKTLIFFGEMPPFWTLQEPEMPEVKCRLHFLCAGANPGSPPGGGGGWKIPSLIPELNCLVLNGMTYNSPAKT